MRMLTITQPNVASCQENPLTHVGRLIGLKSGAAPGAEIDRDARRPAVMDDQTIRSISLVERNQTVWAFKGVWMLVANVVRPVIHRFTTMLGHAL